MLGARAGGPALHHGAEAIPVRLPVAVLGKGLHLAVGLAPEHAAVDLGVVLGHAVPDVRVEGRDERIPHAVLVDMG